MIDLMLRHVAGELFNQPWMMEENRLRTFQQVFLEVLERKQMGVELTAEQLAARVGEKKQAPAGGGKIAVVPVYGFIHRFASQVQNVSGSGGTSVEQVRNGLRAALNDPNVEQILLAVDSPGGSVHGVDELASELYQARQQKPVTAHVDPMAASAAYYLASQANEIVVAPSSEVGSIGVFATHMDVSKMNEIKGVKATLISAGRHKTMGNPFEPLNEEARGFLQQRVNEYYDMFVGAVARGRGVSPAMVRDGMGEGRMVGAKEAVQLGMADRVATLDATLQRLMKNMHGGMMAAAAPVVVLAGESAHEHELVAAVATALEHPPVSPVSHTSITAQAESTEAQVATPQIVPAPGAELNTALAAERARAATITSLAQRHGMAAKADAWIANGTSVQDVQAEILTSLRTSAAPLPPAPAVEVIGERGPKKTPSQSLATCARALAKFKGDMRAAANFASVELHDGYAAAALGASSGSGGGFVIPEAMAQDIIEILRPKAVVRSLAPVEVPLVNGQLTLPGGNSGASASYIGENKDITATAVSFRQAKLNAKKLACLVAISNDLLRYTPGVGADNFVRNDMVRAVRQAEDLAFLRGSGTAYSPKGLRNWCPSANVIDANATVNLANITTDLGKLVVALMNANVDMTTCAWIWAPRTWNYLMTVRTANGEYAFREEMLGGTFWGFPYRNTTQIPVNLNLLGSSNETEIMLVGMADVVIGDVPVMVMDTSQEASWYDGSNYQSAYSQDQTIIRMIMEHDLAVRHVESIAVLQKAIWI